jgi:hypothetical protein
LSAPDEAQDGTKVVHMEASEIHTLVTRLGRPHPSGGTVIERAALMAEGGDLEATIAWIVAHGGEPEARVATAPSRGLHSGRSDAASSAAQTPRRFVLPAGALR